MTYISVKHWAVSGLVVLTLGCGKKSFSGSTGKKVEKSRIDSATGQPGGAAVNKSADGFKENAGGPSSAGNGITSVSTESGYYKPDGEIKVSYSDARGTAGEKIVIFPSGSDPSKAISSVPTGGKSSGSVNIKAPPSSATGEFVIAVVDAEGKIIAQSAPVKKQLVCDDKLSLRLGDKCVPTIPVFRWKHLVANGEEFISLSAGPECAALAPEKREIASSAPGNINGKIPHSSCNEWVRYHRYVGPLFRTAIVTTGGFQESGFVKLFRAFNYSTPSRHIFTSDAADLAKFKSQYPSAKDEGSYLLLPAGTPGTVALKKYLSAEFGYFYRLGEDKSELPADSKFIRDEGNAISAQ